MNTLRRSYVRIFLFFISFVLVAARFGDTAERGPEKVRVAVSSKSLGFLDTWAAQQRGFYRKHGIDAEIIAMRPPLTIGALQAGEIDYAIGASTISRGSISGAPVQQGKQDLLLDRVVDATIIEEVLRERR